jgi:hypothetical protein
VNTLEPYFGLRACFKRSSRQTTIVTVSDLSFTVDCVGPSSRPNSPSHRRRWCSRRSETHRKLCGKVTNQFCDLKVGSPDAYEQDYCGGTDALCASRIVSSGMRAAARIFPPFMANEKWLAVGCDR